VTTYLMEANNLRNHLSALEESISDQQLVNIVLNSLPRSFDMVVQGIFLHDQSNLRRRYGKSFNGDNKIGQEEALAVYFRPHHRPHVPFYQVSNLQRGRGFARPSGLYYSTSSNQFHNNFMGVTSPIIRNAPQNIRPPMPHHHSFPTHAPTSSGQL
jgi:hypothetical protein